MEVRTGYKRSYSVVVRKMLNDEILAGYPKVYPTAIDVANGYFVLGGAHIPVMTQNELQNLTQSEYEARISLLKDYVIQQEGMNPFTNQFNENVVYDPENCVPQEITTTTTEITTTTTTSGVYPVKYGALYNWYAATDSRNIANVGWSIGDYNQYQILADYLGASGDYYHNTVGRKLKEIGTTYWTSPNTGATNEVRFNARGSGNRDSSGIFNSINGILNIWGTIEFDLGINGFTAAINYSNDWLFLGQVPKTQGCSLRLVKDSTTLSNGQSGTYTGNDGKVYRTICIGTQEWLADTLCETKYRNGDWIHGYDSGVYTPIANATWAALTTEAMCFYNDDESNG